MSDCPNGELRDLLPELLHDRLPPAERQRAEAHLRVCAECREELALLRSLRGTLARRAAVDAAAIAAAIPAYRRTSRTGRSWSGWRAAAAVALLAGGTSVVVLQRGGDVARDSLVAVTASAPGGTTTVPAPGVPAAESPAVAVGTRPSASGAGAQGAASRELALGSSAVTELSDGELSTLLANLESLEALPSADVEPVPVTPIAPKGSE